VEFKLLDAGYLSLVPTLTAMGHIQWVYNTTQATQEVKT
jgi:hypothetical protein